MRARRRQERGGDGDGLGRQRLLALLLLPAAGLVALSSAAAFAAEGFVIGDSIGSGLMQFVGLPGSATKSVGFRRSQILDQIVAAPKGAVVLMSLGLNDAADPVPALAPHIERVIATALGTSARFVWIGPPCVAKAWDGQAAKLDAHLRLRLAETSIQYVGLRQREVCNPAIRTRDGEHFTPAGYVVVWKLIQGGSSYAAEVRAVPTHSATKRADTRPRPARRRTASGSRRR